MSRGKCSPQPNNMFYHCGSCCAEIKCTDKSCPWVTACKEEDYRNCEHYAKPTDYRRRMGEDSQDAGGK